MISTENSEKQLFETQNFAVRRQSTNSTPRKMKLLFLFTAGILGLQVRTPSQLILQKLSEMAQGWADFYIGNVLNREGRADKFKDRIIKRLEKIDEHYVTCQSKGYERRRRRSNKLEANISQGMFDETTGRQIKKLSQDPIRSNAQIFVNIRNWVYRNMADCPQAQRHFDKLGDLEEKWTNVFNTVLQKIDQKRSHW